jgi:XTP/dITP diphosphohydrolase
MTSAGRLLLATTNVDKIKEIHALLCDVPVDLIGLDRFPDLQPPEETGATFAENARLKALYYARATGLPAVAEDSGLEVDALGGAPGVHSARFGGAEMTYPERFVRLYALLDELGTRESTARFVCQVALAWEERVLFEARGVVEGRIAREPHGTGGFGYDPIFFHPPSGMTLAEVTSDVKRAVSHRGEAFRRLAGFLTLQSGKKWRGGEVEK